MIGQCDVGTVRTPKQPTAFKLDTGLLTGVWTASVVCTYHLQMKEPSASDVLPAAYYCQSCYYSLRLLRTLRKQQIKQKQKF